MQILFNCIPPLLYNIPSPQHFYYYSTTKFSCQHLNAPFYKKIKFSQSQKRERSFSVPFLDYLFFLKICTLYPSKTACVARSPVSKLIYSLSSAIACTCGEKFSTNKYFTVSSSRTCAVTPSGKPAAGIGTLGFMPSSQMICQRPVSVNVPSSRKAC